jgi:hypothetical protein
MLNAFKAETVILFSTLCYGIRDSAVFSELYTYFHPFLLQTEFSC